MKDIYLLTLATATVVACANPPALDVEANETWKRHEEVIASVVRGDPFVTTEYVAAVEFFETVTQIQCNDNKSFLGRIPNGQVDSALEQWRRWYSANSGRLMWDAAAKQVVLSDK